jgi:hypothetical protein
MKLGCSPAILTRGFPSWFGDLLTYSRSLEFGQVPEYRRIKDELVNLEREFPSPDGEAALLDWTPCYPETLNPFEADPETDASDHDSPYSHDDDTLGSDTYCGWDIDSWTERRCGNRDGDVTLPLWQVKELDDEIPLIADVENLDMIE